MQSAGRTPGVPMCDPLIVGSCVLRRAEVPLLLRPFHAHNAPFHRNQALSQRCWQFWRVRTISGSHILSVSGCSILA